MAAERKEYTVEVNGLPHTVLLDRDDALRLNAVAVVAVKAVTPANKAADPANK